MRRKMGTERRMMKVKKREALGKDNEDEVGGGDGIKCLKMNVRHLRNIIHVCLSTDKIMLYPILPAVLTGAPQ